MPLTGLRAQIEVEPRLVRTSGWLSAGTVIDVDGPELMGAEYETETCIADDGGEWIDKCLMPFGGHDESQPAPTGFVPAPGGANEPWQVYDKKTFQDPQTLVTGDPFTTFAGVRCDLVSFTEEEYRAKSIRKFNMVESRQVDDHIARWIENNGNDLGDCPLSQMIMNADYVALKEYGSYPVIGMSAPLMTCAAAQGLIHPCPADVCAPNVGVWRTTSGAYVTTIAQDSRNTQANFFLTGHVTVLRGPRETYTAADVQNNVRRTITERIYVPLVECMAYYATATCDAPVTI